MFYKLKIQLIFGAGCAGRKTSGNSRPAVKSASRKGSHPLGMKRCNSVTDGKVRMGEDPQQRKYLFPGFFRQRTKIHPRHSAVLFPDL